jgi:transcriptional regulator with XRE-family HTH domain
MAVRIDPQGGVRSLLEWRRVGTEPNMMDERELGRRIGAARDAAKLSPEELAGRVNVEPARMRAIEAGASVSTLELELIAVATARPLDYFLQPETDTFEVLFRAGQGSASGIREAVEVLRKFTVDYEFLLSLEE